jgi:hypothetical protein
MGELLALLTALLHAIGVVLYKRSIAYVSPFGLNLFKNCVALTVSQLPLFWAPRTFFQSRLRTWR